MKNPLIYAVIPARSGSKGLQNKNIRLLKGKPLIYYSIQFAKKLNVDKIICSTDSEHYAEIAKDYGAEVPFLRSSWAAADNAMEQDILKDMYEKFVLSGIKKPDIIVWLRPTFVFRNIQDVKRCINILKLKPEFSAVRTVCESEARLYDINGDHLIPEFDDHGKSMIRRQDIGKRYKVFSTDVFRFASDNLTDDFLGRNIAAVVTNKICGLDIDDEIDFSIVECLINHKKDMINEYL
jgi:CMP-N,N'-diacetyllegionaminic acid synthase